MKNKTFLQAGVMALLLVFGAFAFSFFSQSKADGGGNWQMPRPKLNLSFGSAGNDFFSLIRPNVGASFNGASLEGAGQTFFVATTTACSLISPIATSSLIRLFVDQTTSTTSAVTLHIATSTRASRYATTTPLWGDEDDQTWPSGAKRAFSFTPTTTEKSVFAPNTALIVSFKGGTTWTPNSSTTQATGSCSALWQRFQ